MKKEYFLVVLGSHELATIRFGEAHPTDKEIEDAIEKWDGRTARIEERFVLKERDWKELTDKSIYM